MCVWTQKSAKPVAAVLYLHPAAYHLFSDKQFRCIKTQGSETQWDTVMPRAAVSDFYVPLSHFPSITGRLCYISLMSYFKRPSFHISLFLGAFLVPSSLFFCSISVCSHLRVTRCVGMLLHVHFGSFCCSLTLLMDIFNLLCSPLSLVL